MGGYVGSHYRASGNLCMVGNVATGPNPCEKLPETTKINKPHSVWGSKTLLVNFFFDQTCLAVQLTYPHRLSCPHSEGKSMKTPQKVWITTQKWGKTQIMRAGVDAKLFSIIVNFYKKMLIYLALACTPVRQICVSPPFSSINPHRL